MSTTEQGRGAESRVATQLEREGYKVISLNWRNRWCEIDIVAKKDHVVSFVEVKYRSSMNGGDGFEAITKRKLLRMQRAAEAWVQQENWSGEYQILVAAADINSIEIRELY